MSELKPPKFKRIRKAWGKGLRSLPTLDGKRHRKDELDTLKALPVGENTQFDTTPDDINELAKVLQDESLARRIRKLQHTKYPYGTVPELLMLDYLTSRHERYVYQAELFGGFRNGGLVPDFVVQRAGGWRAINIQGQYWHNIPGKPIKDAADKLRMIGAPYDGQPILDVVFVWERRIMSPDASRERTFQNATLGIEEGP